MVGRGEVNLTRRRAGTKVKRAVEVRRAGFSPHRVAREFPPGDRSRSSTRRLRLGVRHGPEVQGFFLKVEIGVVERQELAANHPDHIGR